MQKAESDTNGLLLTLNRGIKVLEEIARSDGLATAKSLSATLDINLGTVYQILRTLQSNGYVNRLPGGRHQLGARVGFLLDHYEIQTAPPQAVIDALHELHLATGDTVYVSLAQGSDVTVVAAREGTRRLRVGNVVVGFSDFPHARASGKAFLAFRDPEDLDSYFDDRQLDPLTDHTITDWEVFKAELRDIRRTGIAYDREEFDDGIACIGAPIIGADGQPVGAYAAALPTARFEHHHAAVTADLMKAAEQASRALGYADTFPPG